MKHAANQSSNPSRWLLVILLIASAALLIHPKLYAQPTDVAGRLEGLDPYMAKLLTDWNTPGAGVGIVVGDSVVLARGYGYRDYEKKLPFTSRTLFRIASNAKLFTAITAGMLVEEGKVTWDEPVRDAVPTLRFATMELDNAVTLRDMLGHRTGIGAYHTAFSTSGLDRHEIFDRVQYLQPSAPLRHTFIYNNLLYATGNHIVELLSGKTWEEFVDERILTPLGMRSTVFTTAEMLKQADYALPYDENRNTGDLQRLPLYEEVSSVAATGTIITSIEDMTRWLTALMNDGKYAGEQVLPQTVVRATLEPSIANSSWANAAMRGAELMQSAYGMGRWLASYRGQSLVYHDGDSPGYHTMVSYMPREKVGIVVFVMGLHSFSLRNAITFNVYERLLGMEETPWSERGLDLKRRIDQTRREGRAMAGTDQVPNTSPSHPLTEYAAEYEHSIYGTIKVGLKDEQLHFAYGSVELPMSHYHFDRFDTPDHEVHGKWSITFLTSSSGEVDKALMHLDGSEATFARKPDVLAPELIRQLTGTYITPYGGEVQIMLKDDGALYLLWPGELDKKLHPYRELAFSNREYVFVMEDGKVKALRWRTPAAEFVLTRR